MTILALAGLSDMTVEEARDFGWFLLFMATLLPACLTLFTGAWRDPFLLALALVQGSAMFFSLRAILRTMRRRGYSEASTSGVMSLFYFPVCLATNALWAAGFILSVHLR